MARNALISVTDSEGIVPFAKSLVRDLNFDIVATDGTAKLLKRADIPVTRVSDYTGVPPLLPPQGVKSIHHKIFTGIMSDMHNPQHLSDLDSINAVHFDLVVCTFYDIDSPLAREKKLFEDVMREVDIGGPAMIRAGGKNLKNVVVVGNKKYYAPIIKQYLTAGDVDAKTRVELAIEAFEYTRKRDSTVIDFLKSNKEEIIGYLGTLKKP